MKFLYFAVFFFLAISAVFAYGGGGHKPVAHGVHGGPQGGHVGHGPQAGHGGHGSQFGHGHNSQFGHGHGHGQGHGSRGHGHGHY